MKYFMMIVFLWIGLWSFQQGSMHVKSGEIFKIVLESNRSTGYGWYWDNKPEKSILDSIYVDYVLKSNMQTGAGGSEMWEFKAKTKGDQMIRMVYKRPWENKPPIKVKEILIKVN